MVTDKPSIYAAYRQIGEPDHYHQALFFSFISWLKRDTSHYIIGNKAADISFGVGSLTGFSDKKRSPRLRFFVAEEILVKCNRKSQYRHKPRASSV